jgi:hypothetical protein
MAHRMASDGKGQIDATLEIGRVTALRNKSQA